MAGNFATAGGEIYEHCLRLPAWHVFGQNSSVLPAGDSDSATGAITKETGSISGGVDMRSTIPQQAAAELCLV